MLIYNIPAQKSFCSESNFEGGQHFTWDNSELLVGITGSGQECKSLLYFDLNDLKARHTRLHLLEAHLVLDLVWNNIDANTAAFMIKELMYPWEPGIVPAGIITSDQGEIPFIIPFHWKELISIDITPIGKKWWNVEGANHGLVIEGCKDGNNLVGFHNSSCENCTQLLLWLRN